jgi:hypothetical protein
MSATQTARTAPSRRPEFTIEVVYWKCPAGHEEADERPLQERLWCGRCCHLFFHDEVTIHGEKREVVFA